jgi:glycerophosphoryl diester phosphodiesterase
MKMVRNRSIDSLVSRQGKGPSQLRVLGHRGSRFPGPDNSISAVSGAFSAGSAGVEVDVRRSADDVLVCCHDPDKAGVMLITAGVSSLSHLEIPLVEEVLDVCHGRGQVVLEVKNVPGEPDFDAPRERTTQLLLDLLRGRRRAGREDDVVVSSFDWFALDCVRADSGHADWAGSPPRTALLMMSGIGLLAGLSTAVEVGYDEVHAPIETVRQAPEMVRRARDVGRAVVAWTVRTAEEAVEMQAAGVDAVICDDPAAVLRALG